MKEVFCSSPWMHIRITPEGNYLPCRWGEIFHRESNHNMATTSIAEYMNSEPLKNLRKTILEGNENTLCQSCYKEDKLNKVSGRQKQLLKSAITLKEFEKSLCASPHFDRFQYSLEHDMQTQEMPVDFQIDLGNTCNSACITCAPEYSSRHAIEFFPKLNKLEPSLFPQVKSYNTWANDPQLVDKFVNEIANIPNVRYIHLLGGETLYLKAFYSLCDKLIQKGLAKNIILGTTTNCTIYTPELVDIIKEFKDVHLGLSVETMTDLNDYIRWPSKIDQVREHILKFKQLKQETDLNISLRITPSILSIYHIDTVFEFMLENNIVAESCNILEYPLCQRVELLPELLRKDIVNKIDKVIERWQLTPNSQTVLNRRNDAEISSVIKDIIFEYRFLLENYPNIDEVDKHRYDLVKYIRAFESLRANTVLDYLPEYEEFLRSYNY